MHSDAVAAGRKHLGDAGEWDESHAFKEIADGRILVDLGDGTIEKLGRSWDEERNAITFGPRLILNGVGVTVTITVVVFDDADARHLVIEVLEGLGLISLIHLEKFFEGVELPELHFIEGDRHLVGDDLAKSEIFGIGARDAFQVMGHHVGYFLS